MRVLIVKTDYPAFMSKFYGQNPGLANASFDRPLISAAFAIAVGGARNKRCFVHFVFFVSLSLSDSIGP